MVSSTMMIDTFSAGINENQQKRYKMRLFSTTSAEGCTRPSYGMRNTCEVLRNFLPWYNTDKIISWH